MNRVNLQNRDLPPPVALVAERWCVSACLRYTRITAGFFEQVGEAVVVEHGSVVFQYAFQHRGCGPPVIIHGYILQIGEHSIHRLLRGNALFELVFQVGAPDDP